MMRVIFYHVGQGDLSLVLLPNGEALMIDCYRADEVVDAKATGEEEVLERIENTIIEHRESVAAEMIALSESLGREKRGEKKVPIRVLLITHADRDHLTVTKRLRERFEIGYLVDSGREYDAGTESMKDYLRYRQAMMEQEKYIAIKRATYGWWPDSGADIDILCPNRDIAKEEDNNNQCMVVRIEHESQSFLFAGDSPWEDWGDEETGILALHGDRLDSDILHVSHHGSRSFFTPSGRRKPGQPEYTKGDYDRRGIQKIEPLRSFITCSDDENSKWPHPIAKEIYEEETNPNVSSDQNRHVVLSRESKNLHHRVNGSGRLYTRTSRSRRNAVEREAGEKVLLKGSVSGGNGYLYRDCIWVVGSSRANSPRVDFEVEAKGRWPSGITFDWWVLNNGQGVDVLHQEYYSQASSDGSRRSRCFNVLAYEGVHLMQCCASAENGAVWANWFVLVCDTQSRVYAEEWLEAFPNAA